MLRRLSLSARRVCRDRRRLRKLREAVLRDSSSRPGAAGRLVQRDQHHRRRGLRARQLVLGVEPDAAEIGRRDAVGLDPGEPGVIEGVQELGPELEPDPLPDGEILVDRDVPVLQGRLLTGH